MALICCEHNLNCDPGPDSTHHSSSLPCVSSIVLFIWCLKITLWIKTRTIIWALNNILSLARTKARTSGLLNHLVFWDLRTTRAGQCAQDNNEDHLNTCLDVWLWGMLEPGKQSMVWKHNRRHLSIYTETIDFSVISTFQRYGLTNLESLSEFNNVTVDS